MILSFISSVIIFIGIAFVSLGIIGLYRFDNFYARILSASKVDTVCYITVLIGVMLKQGVSFFSAKVAFIILITLLVNPLTTHIITRSAYKSGYRIRKD